MTMTETLFKADGTVFTGIPTTNEAGKVGYMKRKTCGRCGGTGVVRPWGVCFRCGGPGHTGFTFRRLFTAEQLVKENARVAKVEAKKTAKAEAKAEAFRAKLAATTAEFDAANADLLAALTARGLVNPDSHDIINDIIYKGRKFGSISEAQKSVLVNAIASHDRAVEQRAKSDYIGVKGGNISVVVTVTKVGSYERPIYNSYDGGMETVFVTTMEDAMGNQIVVKSPNFNQPSADRFVLIAKVKEHTEYKGIRQTVVNYAKRSDDIPRKSFKKMMTS